MDETPFPPQSPPPVPPTLPPSPPIITPPPPTKPRRSWGWMIAALLLGVLLLFSVFGNFVQLASHAMMPRNFKSVSARQVGPRLEEGILEDNDSRNKIAVITVDGIISGHTGDGAGNNMVDLIKAQLDRAADDDRVKAVILKVDSPGGEVMASDQINKAIKDFESGDPHDPDQPKHHGKPVVCSMGSLAASGGYYISAPCKYIVADELTLTGSIGVIMHGYNYRGLMDKIGVLPMTYKSGLYKDMLSPDRSTNEIPAGERAMVQGLIDETYQKFKGVVKEGRGSALKADWESLADGRVLSGQQALTAGFVDALGDFDDAVQKAEDLSNISKANLIEYQEKYDISNFLSMFGENNKAHDIKLDLGMQAPNLQPGCLYFLSPTFINY